MGKNILIYGVGNSGMPLVTPLSLSGNKLYAIDPNVDIEKVTTSVTSYKGLGIPVTYHSQDLIDPKKEELKPDLIIVTTQDQNLEEVFSDLEKRIPKADRDNMPVLVLTNGFLSPEISSKHSSFNIHKGAILFPSSTEVKGHKVIVDVKAEGLPIEIAKQATNGKELDDTTLQAIKISFTGATLDAQKINITTKPKQEDIEFEKVAEILSMGLHALTNTKFGDAATTDNYIGELTTRMVTELYNIANARGKGFARLTKDCQAKDQPDALIEFVQGRCNAKAGVAGSLLPTIASGKTAEIEAIYGRLSEMGKNSNVATPTIDKTLELLRVTQKQAQGKASSVGILKNIQAKINAVVESAQKVEAKVTAFMSIEPESLISEENSILDKLGITQSSTGRNHG